jgi:hypothetical protein
VKCKSGGSFLLVVPPKMEIPVLPGDKYFQFLFHPQPERITVTITTFEIFPE